MDPPIVVIDWDYRVHFNEGPRAYLQAASTPVREKSDYFAATFFAAINPAPGPTVINIVPEDVTPEEFRTFVNIVYPELGDSTTVTFDKAQWTTILRLSTFWFFKSFRRLAIAELEKINTPADRIRDGRNFYIPDWIKNGCYTFVTNAAGISDEEEQQISAKTAAKLWKIRHDLQQGTSRDPMKAVANEFKEELGSFEILALEYV